MDLKKIMLKINYKELYAKETKWCGIYLEYDNLYFPVKNWNDIFAGILNMWISNFILLCDNNSTLIDNMFMDGPFIFRVVKSIDNTYSFYLVERYGFDKERIIDEGILDLSYFLFSLINVTEETISYLRINNIENSEQEEIINNVERLKKILE